MNKLIIIPIVSIVLLLIDWFVVNKELMASHNFPVQPNFIPLLCTPQQAPRTQNIGTKCGRRDEFLKSGWLGQLRENSLEMQTR